MSNIWGQVAAVVLCLSSFGGLLAAFLLDTAIMPWAVAVMVGYALFRVERLRVKVEELGEVFGV